MSNAFLSAFGLALLRLLFVEFDAFFDRLAKGLKRTAVRFFARILPDHPESRVWGVHWRHVEISTTDGAAKVPWA